MDRPRTTVQSLTFITVMVSEKIAVLKFFCRAGRPAGRFSTVHNMDSHVPRESKTWETLQDDPSSDLEHDELQIRGWNEWREFCLGRPPSR